MMKPLILFFVLVCYIGNIESLRSGVMLIPESLPGKDHVVTDDYFDQILDHFDNSTPTYWQQRYYMNYKYWTGNESPIFLLVGGESDATPDMLKGGFMVKMAEKYKALLLNLEHRFYGNSHPTNDTSVDNLKKYLSSQQALADIAYFIDEWNKANNLTNPKWILFGGSYPGNLVAWARLKYPTQVYGGISSSGPLQAEVDFYQFNDVVRNSLNFFYPGCADEVTKGAKRIQKVMKSSRQLRSLKKKIGFCGNSTFDRNNFLDVASLVQGLTSPVASSVQENMMSSKFSIDKTCQIMQNMSIPDPLDRLIELYKSEGYDCLDAVYEDSITSSKDTEWDSDTVKSSSRQWTYQTCNEFGYYQTSSKPDSLFSDTMPLEYSTKQCTDIFGPEYNPDQLNAAVAATNQYYEGTKIKVDRVVFIQGSIDPWSSLGMVENPTEESPFYLVNGTSHCYDMLEPDWDDPPSLKVARHGADKKLNEWLNG